MGDKSKYEGKSKEDLLKEARSRGLTVSDTSSESALREALEQADKDEQGQKQPQNR